MASGGLSCVHSDAVVLEVQNLSHDYSAFLGVVLRTLVSSKRPAGAQGGCFDVQQLQFLAGGGPMAGADGGMG